ncbi:hypothetical protein [Bacillus sp. Marseille-P3800]|uniref:hypothetical protein n=1 Tax=Bacillus sp. Marseille-P3800 TaxID=2014782 RepID=UPI000C084FAE|nr:hypothetical protein [Bacillus sp. Marseille-P3800]
MIKVDQVAHVEIVFENCESIILPIDRVKQLNVAGIKDCLIFNNGKMHNLKDSEYVGIYIKINDESELAFDTGSLEHPLGMFVGNPISNKVNERPYILSRIINHKDISHIRPLNEEFNQIEYIGVPWLGECVNELMETEYDEATNILKVHIGREEN